MGWGSVLPLVRARYGAQALGRKRQWRAKASSFALKTTVRVSASCSVTRARALSSNSSAGTPPKLNAPKPKPNAPIPRLNAPMPKPNAPILPKLS